MTTARFSTWCSCNRATVVDAAAPSPGEGLEEVAEDGAEKAKAMLELPDAVFRLVCRFLE